MFYFSLVRVYPCSLDTLILQRPRMILSFMMLLFCFIVDPDQVEAVPSNPQEKVITEHEIAKRDLPERLNWSQSGKLHSAIYQGRCNSCAWISSVQTLESRIAIASENYKKYSLQNFMNCDNRVCRGSVHTRTYSIARKDHFIVPEEEMPYTMTYCEKWGKPCHCAQEMGNYTNLLDEQHVIIGPTIKANTEAKIIAGLQHGPVSSCIHRNKGKHPTGHYCKPGCNHGVSIIGYTQTKFILQDNYGKHWGPFKNGTWAVPYNLSCRDNLVRHAYYPVIYRDYDKTNAFYTNVLVDEKSLKFMDREGIENMGIAKNECGYLGVLCKGVFVMSTGSIKLVADFGNTIGRGSMKAAKKTQLQVYLKNLGSEKYIDIIKNKGGKFVLKLNKKKSHAAPFFTSYGRFISYEYPNMHMVNNKLVTVSKSISDIDVLNTWTLKNCNLHNIDSGKSLAVVNSVDDKWTLGGEVFNKSSPAQRFDLGVSGHWLLRSRYLNGTELRILLKKNTAFFSSTLNLKNTRIKYFRWNARQILGDQGKPLDEHFKTSERFNLANSNKYAVTPTDFVLSTQDGRFMKTKGKGLVMTKEFSEASQWKFEYNDVLFG